MVTTMTIQAFPYICQTMVQFIQSVASHTGLTGIIKKVVKVTDQNILGVMICSGL
jgi:hypothetical protein